MRRRRMGVGQKEKGDKRSKRMRKQGKWRSLVAEDKVGEGGVGGGRVSNKPTEGQMQQIITLTNN